jgi:large subunit ribosomal protein L13
LEKALLTALNRILVNTLSYRTESAKKEQVKRRWYVVDAEGLIVGRLCSQIASVLRGKHRPDYTPHVDTGDCVVVINADKVRFTGKKMLQKQYLTYSLYPGGQKSRTPADLLAKKPEKIVENAIKGMLPKTKLGRAMYKKLFVYAGTEHPHAAQQPEPLKF